MIGTEDRIDEADVEHELRADLELVQQVDERQHRHAGGAGEHRGAARAAAARWRRASGARGRWRARPGRRSGSRAGRCRRRPRSRVGRRPSARCRRGPPPKDVEVQEQQPQELERDHHERQRADQDALERAVQARQREAGEQEGQRQQPQVAEPDPDRERQRLRPPAQQLRRRTRSARSRPSARRRGSPAGATRPRSRWPRTTSRRAGTAAPAAAARRRSRARSRSTPERDARAIRVRRGSVSRAGAGCSVGGGVQDGRGATVLAYCRGVPESCRSFVTSTCRTSPSGACEHRPAHLELIQAYHADGRMEIAGAVGDPPSYGLLVFRDAESAEAFVADDPYVAGRAGHELDDRALDRRDVTALWERIAGLSLVVEGYSLERLAAFERITTLVVLAGAGETGASEDIMHTTSADAHAARPVPRRSRGRGRWRASATTWRRSTSGRARRSSGSWPATGATGRSRRRRWTSRCARRG